jgi:hypothetical protein
MKENEPLEINLGANQCAEVALYMFQEYEKEMQKPQFSIPSFKDWLQQFTRPPSKGVTD